MKDWNWIEWSLFFMVLSFWTVITTFVIGLIFS